MTKTKPRVGRPRLPPTRRKINFNVWVRPDIMDRLQRAVKRDGTTRSEWVERAIVKALQD